MSSKPEVPLKPRNIPPPVPLRTNKPQQTGGQQEPSAAASPAVANSASVVDGESYPMNPTWFFHSPPPSAGGGGTGMKQRPDWDLPPKLCIKSVPVLPVKPQNNSPTIRSPPISGLKSGDSEPAMILPRKDLNFAKEIKSRCSQRLTERLPPQMHYSSNVSIFLNCMELKEGEPDFSLTS